MVIQCNLPLPYKNQVFHKKYIYFCENAKKKEALKMRASETLFAEHLVCVSRGIYNTPTVCTAG